MEQRAADRGPNGRRMDWKTLLVGLGLAGNVLVMVWKGGEISQKFDTLLKTTEVMQHQVSAILGKQNADGTEIRVLQERILNHERRIERLERKP